MLISWIILGVVTLFAVLYLIAAARTTGQSAGNKIGEDGTLKIILVILFGIISFVLIVNRWDDKRLEARAAEKKPVVAVMQNFTVAKGAWSPLINANYAFTVDAVPGRRVRINGLDSRIIEWTKLPVVGGQFKIPSDSIYIELGSLEAELICNGVPYVAP